ncbi:TPA: hypothetical protein SIA31_000011 [Aeromonas sobria]|nr:hypothetical protein [Aeromonas sobria]
MSTQDQDNYLNSTKAPALMMGYFTTPCGMFGNAFLIRTELGECIYTKAAMMHIELEAHTDGEWDRTIVYFDHWTDDEKHNNVIANASAVINTRNHTTDFDFIRI